MLVVLRRFMVIKTKPQIQAVLKSIGENIRDLQQSDEISAYSSDSY